MRIRQLNHSVYQLSYHIVWGTKYRRKILKEYVRTALIKQLYAIQRQHPDWYFLRINTGADHVHLLMEIPPKYSVSSVVQIIKALTSTGLRKQFKFIDRIYEKGHMWSPGYFVSSVGLNEEQIMKYIQLQNNYDLGRDVSGELS